MPAATVTFDQMERRADRTLAVVLWAKHVKNVAEGAALFKILELVLRSLVHSLSADEKLSSLPDQQAQELMSKLEELHAQLVSVLDHHVTLSLSRKFLFRNSIRNIEENTEDLCDLLENLALSRNSDFRALVADCVKSISSATAEPVGRV